MALHLPLVPRHCLAQSAGVPHSPWAGGQVFSNHVAPFRTHRLHPPQLKHAKRGISDSPLSRKELKTLSADPTRKILSTWSSRHQLTPTTRQALSRGELDT